MYYCFQKIVNNNDEILRWVEALNSNSEHINTINILNISTYLHLKQYLLMKYFTSITRIINTFS